jgi:hypothetical protein
MDRKARVQELAADIAVSSAFEAAAVKELLELMIADATEALVDAQPSDFQRLQGEAQSLRKLFTLVTRPALRSKE